MNEGMKSFHFVRCLKLEFFFFFFFIGSKALFRNLEMDALFPINLTYMNM